MPSPPAAAISSPVSSIVSGRLYSDGEERVLRPVAYTVAPARASSTAMARPAPRVAPATRATFPSKRSVILRSDDCLLDCPAVAVRVGEMHEPAPRIVLDLGH